MRLALWTVAEYHRLPRRGPRKRKAISQLGPVIQRYLEDAQIASNEMKLSATRQQFEATVGTFERTQQIMEMFDKWVGGKLKADDGREMKAREATIEILFVARPPGTTRETIGKYLSPSSEGPDPGLWNLEKARIAYGSLEALVKTHNAFEFLSFACSKLKEQDVHAVNLVDMFFRTHWQMDLEEALRSSIMPLPFAQFSTMIAQYCIALVCARDVREDEWASVGFQLKPTYNLTVITKKQTVPNPSIKFVIEVIYMACLDLRRSGALSDGIRYENAGVIVEVRGRILIFGTTLGFFEFFTDFHNSIGSLLKTGLRQVP